MHGVDEGQIEERRRYLRGAAYMVMSKRTEGRTIDIKRGVWLFHLSFFGIRLINTYDRIHVAE